MSRFQGDGSKEYDARIQKLIPGYNLLQELTVASLLESLGDEARLLVVGAGTGSESLRLLHANKHWTLTALDISTDMLEIARQRFVEKQVESQVSLHHGEVSTLPAEPVFDCALCFFVLHFLPADGSKVTMLREIQSRLKPGACLFLADLMKPAHEHERLFQARMSTSLGLSPVKAEKMLSRLEADFFPLSEEGLETLARASGFQRPHRYFQAFGFHGFLLQKPS